jgi:hypothetical protein
MLFSGKLFSFLETIYDICRKFFGISGKFIFIFRKKYDICGKIFLVCPENFFEFSAPRPPPPPPSPTFPGKTF